MKFPPFNSILAAAVMVSGSTAIWIIWTIGGHWVLASMLALLVTQWAWVALETGKWVFSWDQICLSIDPRQNIGYRYLTVAGLIFMGFIGSMVAFAIDYADGYGFIPVQEHLWPSWIRPGSPPE